MFGFINIYKPKGKTSHDVVAILRRITKVKQIGHTGTLDPFAEGVLPVCIGKSTRLIEYLDDEKAYIGTVKLGNSTSTFDIEGEGVNFSDKKVTREEIETALKSFRGEIEQIPPIYSALKVNGKKLYEYARKGEEVEIQPRKVTINKLEILNFDSEANTLELYIDCSKGTYIRSIANDLGEELGCFGHLVKLVRVKAGGFILENTVKLEEFQDENDIKSHLENPLNYLNFPKYDLSASEKEKVSHGMEFYANIPDGLVVLVENNTIAGIATAKNSVIKCNKVFL